METMRKTSSNFELSFGSFRCLFFGGSILGLKGPYKIKPYASICPIYRFPKWLIFHWENKPNHPSPAIDTPKKIWRFPEMRVPPVIIHLNKMFHCKPSNWGYHFRNPKIFTALTNPIRRLCSSVASSISGNKFRLFG